jgi:hypothetical protein
LGSNVTTPSFLTSPSIVLQAIFSSGRCSVISVVHSRLSPPMSATQWNAGADAPRHSPKNAAG